MPLAVALLDLYETLVSGDWPRWGELVRSRLGVDAAVLDRALDDTREARNTGAFASETEDWHAVLVAAGVEPDDATIRGADRDPAGLHDDGRAPLRRLAPRRARAPFAGNQDGARQQLLAGHPAGRRPARTGRRVRRGDPVVRGARTEAGRTDLRSRAAGPRCRRAGRPVRGRPGRVLRRRARPRHGHPADPSTGGEPPRGVHAEDRRAHGDPGPDRRSWTSEGSAPHAARNTSRIEV